MLSLCAVTLARTGSPGVQHVRRDCRPLEIIQGAATLFCTTTHISPLYSQSTRLCPHPPPPGQIWGGGPSPAGELERPTAPSGGPDRTGVTRYFVYTPMELKDISNFFCDKVETVFCHHTECQENNVNRGVNYHRS